ncbi:MAG: hypothetical protein MJ246_07615 [Clostridia bacterium]|nr:hypothetical protein [Clostridia bacterium]
MKKVFTLLLVSLLGITLSGCEFKDVLNYVEEAFKDDYLMDADLESATWKNSAEPGAITGRRALDAVKEKYASSFNKKLYFDEIGESEDKGYVYFNKHQEMYLALSGLVELEGEDYYEIILFTYDKPGDIYDYSKTILESYYVKIDTLEIFESGNKPVETYVLSDDTYGFKLNMPKEFEDNYIFIYSDPSEMNFGGRETTVRTITASYREGNVSDELFDIVIFEGAYKAEDFKASEDAYFLGTNNKYTICLVKASLTDNYLQNPRKILTEHIEKIASSAKLYDADEDEKEEKENKETKKQ